MNAQVVMIKNNYYVKTQEYINGKVKSRTISVRKALGLKRRAEKKEANALRDKIMTDYRSGIYVKPSTKLFEQYLLEWFEYYKHNIKPSTQESYEEQIKNHIIPALGNIPISEISPPILREFIKNKLENGRLDGKGGLSRRTVKYLHTIIKIALSNAMEDEIIIKNPTLKVKPPKQIKPTIEYWEWDKAQKFIGLTQDRHYHIAWYVALNTGLTRGELLGLRWQDIDWNKNTISIKQSIIEHNNSYLIQSSTKTATRSRTIDVSPKLLSKLAEHKEKQKQELTLLKIQNKNNLIFTTKTGKPCVPSSFYNNFKRTVRSLIKKGHEIPEISVHGLRHTHATFLLEEGWNFKAISERLGHASIQVTLNTYSHVSPRLQKEIATATDSLDAKYNDNPEKTKKWPIPEDDLLKLVWSMPMTEVAKQFGISNNAVKKRCQKVKIPLPPAGFWAKVKAGKVEHPNGKPLK